jgi:hypothetical protein
MLSSGLNTKSLKDSEMSTTASKCRICLDRSVCFHCFLQNRTSLNAALQMFTAKSEPRTFLDFLNHGKQRSKRELWTRASLFQIQFLTFTYFIQTLVNTILHLQTFP